MSIVRTDQQIKDYFLSLDAVKIGKYIFGLKSSLEYFSNDNQIIPSRIVHKTEVSDVTHIYMPVISEKYSGLKNLVYNPRNGKGFVGTVMITNPSDGAVEGLLDAKEITGIRTAMVSCIPIVNLLQKYVTCGNGTLNVTVFGTGLQSFWHIFILIKLYYQLPELNTVQVTILFRENELDISLLISSLKDSPFDINFKQHQWDTDVSEIISESNIIFGCVPTTEPHILYKDIFKATTEDQDVYVSMIGSYKPDMVECDSKLIDEFISQDAKIIVDSKTHTLEEAGELIKSNIKVSNVIELGNLSTSELPTISINQKRLSLCKIVGLAIMDIALARSYLTDTIPNPNCSL